MSQAYEIMPMINDAFCYSTPFYRQHKPYNYFTLQIQRLDTLRRAATAGTYRMRQYVTPLNLTALAGLQTRKDQVRIVPGSYVWALTFCVVEGSITDFNMTITDHDTGDEFFSAPVSGGLSNYPLLQMLDEPRPMLGSGQLDITMVNRINATRTPQLVITCAEPCVIATEGN